MPIKQIPDPLYFPQWWEFATIVVYAAAIIWLGWLAKQRWARMGEAVPIPVAIILWIGMFLLYCALPFTFYVSAAPAPHDIADLVSPSRLANPTPPPPDRQMMLLMWCLLAWIAPVWYYTATVVNSLAVRTVDRIGPFSGHIEDPSEFAAARKRALRGDIDGAVALYRANTDDPANALFEAARLLRSEDRFEESASLLQEVTTRFYGKLKIWAEAQYQLAKLQETQLGLPEVAIAGYKAVIERAADTRFGESALADLSRLQMLHGRVPIEDDDEHYPRIDPPVRAKPAKMEKPKPVPVPKAEAASEEEAHEEGVPVEDPFYSRKPFIKAKAVAEAAMAEKPAARSKTDGKGFAKPAAKSTAKAKPKAAAKKKAAKR